MGKIQFVFPVIIWKRVSFFLVAAFSAIFFLNQSYVARASTNGKSDIAMYDVEVDALQLVGEIVKISPLPKRYKTKLNSQLLENFMVEVKIVTNATGCLNHKFAFLIRKGINVSLLTKDRRISFLINKNTCDPKKLMTILNIEYLPQEKK